MGIRYEVDPHNRLVVQETGRKLPLARFRRVLDGSFRIGPGNTLIYHIKAPMYGLRHKPQAPHQLKLKGKWSLNENHDLVLTLDKWRRQIPGDELTLKGEIVSNSENAVLFAVTTRSEKNLDSTGILKLEGIWRADEHNRLTFRVNKGRGRHDTLILDSIWEVNKQHWIIYRYEKVRLIRKKRSERALTFRGRWNITRRNRLSYEIGFRGKSAFEFRADIAKLGKDYIRCRVGIAVSGKKEPAAEVITLFGSWKIKKNLGLLFEVDYGKAMVFGADAKLTERDNIEFRLRNERGRSLGLELKLSRKLLKGDGQAFLKLLKDKKEASIYAGAGWRF